MLFFKNSIKYGQAKKKNKKLDLSIFKFKNNEYKKYFIYKKNKAGRSNLTKKKILFSKKSRVSVGLLTFNYFKLDNFFLINFFLFNFKLNKFLTEIIYPNGIKTFIKTINNTYIGGLNRFFSPLSNIIKSKFGDCIPLIFLKSGIEISNISIINKINKKISVYAISNGTRAKVQLIDLDNNRVLIKLPSKKLKFFNFFDFCLIGRNVGIQSNSFFNKSAGFNNKLGVASKVRGVAKNPCDHPNGGKTKKKKLWKTPWGKNAKFTK